MLKACDHIDFFKIYIQLYMFTYHHDNSVVFWKGKTYKYGMWSYRI